MKTRYFFLADTLFWVKDINKDFKETNSELFRNFEKVNWKMDIICPSKGYRSIKKRIRNKFIKVEKIRHWSIDFKSRFIDGENYIACNMFNIEQKINCILDPKNRKEIDRIRRNGFELVQKKHKISDRFKYLDDIVEEKSKMFEKKLKMLEKN